MTDAIEQPKPLMADEALIRGIGAAHERAKSARDSLIAASKEPVRYETDAAYALAIDELDKLVFGLRIMMTNKTNRDRWLTKL